MTQRDPILVSYASAVYGQEEIEAVMNVLKNPKRLVSGLAVKEFEERIAKLFGKNFGVMVNSGSSANLIALEVLDIPLGSEVITPVLTFGTTVAPIVQKGLIPVFVDVSPGTYLIDTEAIEQLITERTKALMIPSLIGNIPDLEFLRELADRYDLWLIEDSCDTLNATFRDKPTGTYTDISTTSFYASHIITTAGGGGMVCFHDEKLSARAIVLSNWGRNSTLFGFYEKSEDLDKRFDLTLDGDLYDAKFIFSEIGYNFQSTELNGAFGLVQLSRLGEFSKRRRKNFLYLMKFFEEYAEFFVLPKQLEIVKTNWLAFPLVVRSNAPFSRDQLVFFLEKHRIQTRPVFSGNVLSHPAFSRIQCRTLPDGYPVADNVMSGSVMIGCHHGLEQKHLNYIEEVFSEFLKNY